MTPTKDIYAIPYCRVSDDDQVRGFSLADQEELIKKYCNIKGISQVHPTFFDDGHSAKTFERPAWKALMEYVKANRRGKQLFVMVQRWDRFARNQLQALQMIDTLHNMEVLVNATSEFIQFEVPQSRYMLNFFLTHGEVENLIRSKNTLNGMHRGAKEGYFMGVAPFGYRNIRSELDKGTLAPHEDKAEAVQYAFREFAKGVISTQELRIEIQRKYGYKLGKNSVPNMLRNVTYTGRIRVKAFREEPEQVVPGHHEAIIDDQLFAQVQERLTGNSRATKFVKRVDDNLPLRGHLVCSKCESNLTGSASKGRKQYYYYYHCTSSCGERYRADEANKEFEDMLRSMRISPAFSAMYKMELHEELLTTTGDARKESQRLQLELDRTAELLESAEDKYFRNEIDSDTFSKVKARYSRTINESEARLQQIRERDTNIAEYIENSCSLLENLDYYYGKADVDLKNKIIGSIFPEKLVYRNNNYRTTGMNSVISLVMEYGGIKKEKGRNNPALPKMAPPLGEISNRIDGDLKVLSQLYYEIQKASA